jgi:predicted metalloendopeptidase
MRPLRHLAAAAALGCTAIAQAQSPVLTLGIDTTNFDRSVRPQDDLFMYINGGWLRRVQMPPDASRWGAFNELREKSRASMHSILDELSRSKAAVGGERRMIADVYTSFMDSAAIEKLGVTPIQSELDAIAGVAGNSQLPAAFAHAARIGVRFPFRVTVDADPKRSTVNIVVIDQSGLGMPDRDYYLLDTPKMAEMRQAYQHYLADLLTAANQPDPGGAAARVVALETELAKKQWDRARDRDANATYNKLTIPKLRALSSNFDWYAYIAVAGLIKATDIDVRQLDYITGVDAIVAATPVTTWREYLTAQLLDSYANDLPAALVTARFEFRGRALSGQQQNGDRWKRGVDEVEATFGDAIGKVYVERNFKPAAKTRIDAMIQNLITAYRIGIDSLDWMTPPTKLQAKDKLTRLTVKIGYPARYKDYTGVTTDRTTLFADVRRARIHGYDRMALDLGRPVDRSRWGMTPQTVNAYYNPSNNEIVFPAAILQPPFFDPDADDAVNYGGIGAVIGHEIGHAFDDQGRKYDAAGNLRDWWTKADAAAFDARTAKLGAQYDAIVPIDSIHINGSLTMGENIGDLSGLAQAYRAYHIALGGREPPVIGGFTGDQRFFLGFGQIWRTKYLDDALRQQLLSNEHSPGQYRAFVPLVNNDAFMKAFSVQPGDRMWRAPADRVKIW